MGGEVPFRPAPPALPRLAERPVGQRINSIYTDRLKQFTSSGQYEGQNLISKYWEATNSDEDHVKLSVYSVPDLHDRPSRKQPPMSSSQPTSARHLALAGPHIGSGSTLLSHRTCLHKERLEFHWDANNEGLIWTEDGHPLQGLTGGGERMSGFFPRSGAMGRTHTFYIEMACNGMFGNAPGGDSIQPPNPNKYFSSQYGCDYGCESGCSSSLL